MRRKKPDRDVQRVVKRVLPLVPTSHAVVKEEFERILGEVMACVHEKTGVEAERLGQLKDKVLGDLPNEYGRRDPRDRSWEALITYLYNKFLREIRAT